jgi:hypothetical protein
MLNTLSRLLPQLDTLILSLKLPVKEGDQGELLFRATNLDLYISKLITIPLVDGSQNFMSNSRALLAEIITFDSQVPLQAICESPEWAAAPCHAAITPVSPTLCSPRFGD